MWCYARDVNEWREQAGAVIEAYNKAMAAGALQSTAERAAAAVAYKIDPGYKATAAGALQSTGGARSCGRRVQDRPGQPGYRAFINDDKHCRKMTAQPFNVEKKRLERLYFWLHFWYDDVQRVQDIVDPGGDASLHLPLARIRRALRHHRAVRARAQ